MISKSVKIMLYIMFLPMIIVWYIFRFVMSIIVLCLGATTIGKMFK